MEDEEPLAQIDQGKEQIEGNDWPPSKRIWWKRMESRKKKRSPSPRTNTTHTSPTNFGELEFISLLTMNKVGSVPSAIGGERLHVFEHP